MMAAESMHTPSTLYIKTSILTTTCFLLVINCNYIQIFQPLGEERGCIGSWWGNRRERDHWGDLGVDGWVILGWISRRWDVGIWTGLGWLRIETGGGRL